MPACEVHGLELSEGTAPIRYGLIQPSRRYIAARSKDFPHSYLLVLGGCVVSADSPTEIKVQFCRLCRQAEESWKEDPLDRFEDHRKGDLLRRLQAAQGKLAQEFGNTLDTIFPLALERARLQQELNLLVQEHDIEDEDYSSRRVDILLESVLHELAWSLNNSLPEMKRAHERDIYSEGWAR